MKLGFQIKAEDIDKIVNCKPEAVERCLLMLKKNIEEAKLRPPVVERRPPQGQMQPSYTNVISPVETPTYMAVNQHFPPFYNPGLMQPKPQPAPMRPIIHQMPPDTPISRVPPGPQHERRRTLRSLGSPVMQRAGLQAANSVPDDNYGGSKPHKEVDTQQYQGLSTKQLIGILSNRDTRIQDLVDAIEILELKSRKLEQLVQIKDAELRVWQNK